MGVNVKPEKAGENFRLTIWSAVGILLPISLSRLGVAVSSVAAHHETFEEW